ncbi:SDR family NAD(P)-dependent oxidoreductase [Amycolatopsis rhabdoformis]|uniref:SDR family NAD(P)-dependent oxidoreductase n=1 Tax=Amycolatopsis rhabdoformis TaxID=1448059 RepID=A0ABZ1IJA8_9PSEU|nr:SDR family NAD(P)-dependent oxidoreductase [Amycolatopsis rhabdoformis]WSE34530.1 SDR family NAD(P)-dependent oxidoreductase [Amycolatopsis rhabdoformis]
MKTVAPESIELTSTVALVTGASSGIGEATARELANRGATVVLVARRRDRLDALAKEITAQGGEALALTTDLTDADAAAEVVATTVERLGRLDTLVNAAGVMLTGDSEAAPLTEWQRMVDINLTGLLYVTKAALPHLTAAAATSPRRVADVVNISSIAGRWIIPQAAVYNATKFGVTAATEAWRQEYARRNVRFSVIEPGLVETELAGHQQTAVQERMAAKFADVEQLRADDIAEAVAYIVTGPRHRAVAEIVIRPTDQV